MRSLKNGRRQFMRHHLVIDGNAFYEVDDDCMAIKKQKEEERLRMTEEERKKKLRKEKSDS